MTDPANARVLIYAAGSTQATGVLGQPDLKTGLPWGDSWNTLHDWRQELFAKPAVPITASTFRWPSSVAVDPAGTVYVSDSGNNGVLFFARGATAATRASGQPDLTSRIKDLASDFEWGDLIASPTSLYKPMGLNVDASGNLFVADNGGQRVLEYPPGSTAPVHRYAWGLTHDSAQPLDAVSIFEGRFPDGACRLDNATAVAVDAN